MALKKRRNMHRADIIAELKKRGISLAELGRRHGRSIHTAKNALDKPYPNGERWIADALGMEPKDIWPDRY
ncbi:helix-turn-helix domain-containing protein [Salmonella enterica]|nr:transcriptional regulator [Salmonella enterica]EBS1342471.1 transcriptional regulator [Salmonella enterica subsp. enterica serovar Kottbus]EBS3225105.1 transcriptional regulator [Salmonella enterica subsp. enterica serovar Newport]ECW2976790.1 transcriptional regulator [Salmonella enterica subsp. diarizonae]EEF7429242.1 transcriptional regulator [Salmonella enterica subsp. enterica serovar Java]